MSTGSTGYPDGQRVDSWTNEDPVYTLEGAQTGQVNSPIIYLGSYGYVVINFRMSVGNPLQVVFSFFGDQAGTIIIPGLQVLTTTGLTNGMKYWTPALGPYVQISTIPNGGAPTYTPHLEAYLTNQSRPWVCSAPGMFVYDLQPASIAAGGNLVTIANAHSSGKHQMYVNGGTGGTTVLLEQLFNTTPTWKRFAQYSVPANVDDCREMNFPVHATRLTLTNQNGGAASTGVYAEVFQAI